MRRSLACAGLALVSLSVAARGDDHSFTWLERCAMRTPLPHRPVEHSAERAGYPLSVSKCAAPSVTRYDYPGYIGGASLKNNNLCARGPGSAVGPVYDGTFATDYGGVRAHLGRVFLAPSTDPSVGRPAYLAYRAEGPRVTDVFAIRPLRKAVLEKREAIEELKHGGEGHGAAGHGAEGGHGEAGHGPEAGAKPEGGN